MSLALCECKISCARKEHGWREAYGRKKRCGKNPGEVFNPALSTGAYVMIQIAINRAQSMVCQRLLSLVTELIRQTRIN
jgi:hypothetical protein